MRFDLLCVHRLQLLAIKDERLGKKRIIDFEKNNKEKGEEKSNSKKLIFISAFLLKYNQTNEDILVMIRYLEEEINAVLHRGVGRLFFPHEANLD